MPRPREFDIDEAIQAAMLTFWEQGYEATSLDDLLDRTGIARSSLYQAFGSKHGLFDRALERYNRVQISAMIGDMETSEDGLVAITRFFAGMKQQVENDLASSAAGCLMTNSMAERGSEDDSVGKRSRAYRARLAAAFLRQLDIASHQGEIASGDQDDRSKLLAASTVGFFVYLRGSDDPAELVTLLEALINQVDGWRIAPPAGD